MYKCESRTIKKAEHLRIDAFELWYWRRLFKSPLNSKETKPVNPKRNQPWIFIGKTDAEAELLILWSPDVKSQLTGKDPDAGKDWRQEKGVTKDEMVEWHHPLNGHEFEQTLRESEGQGSLVCCSPWGFKKLDTTEWLNNKNKHARELPSGYQLISQQKLYKPEQKGMMYLKWWKWRNYNQEYSTQQDFHSDLMEKSKAF